MSIGIVRVSSASAVDPLFRTEIRTVCEPASPAPGVQVYVPLLPYGCTVVQTLPSCRSNRYWIDDPPPTARGRPRQGAAVRMRRGRFGQLADAGRGNGCREREVVPPDSNLPLRTHDSAVPPVDGSAVHPSAVAVHVSAYPYGTAHMRRRL
jgi:hypothetical protein